MRKYFYLCLVLLMNLVLLPGCDTTNETGISEQTTDLTSTLSLELETSVEQKETELQTELETIILPQEKVTEDTVTNEESTEEPVDKDGTDAVFSLPMHDSFYCPAPYSGNPEIIISEHETDFTDEERKCTTPFKYFSELDALGRCGYVYINACAETIPKEPRGEIGAIRPAGWKTVKYPDYIEDNYLYNRCHLAAYCLSGENSNEQNLITGTRYLNETLMLPYETKVAKYLDTHPDHHVLYLANPFFNGNDLVATGVELQAFSVEDAGQGISFHVFLYNIQPNIGIDYATGESRVDATPTPTVEPVQTDIPTMQPSDEQTLSPSGQSEESGIPVVAPVVIPTQDETVIPDIQKKDLEAYQVYSIEEATVVANVNTKKIHRIGCKSVRSMKEKNKAYWAGKDAEEYLMQQGYSYCHNCH